MTISTAPPQYPPNRAGLDAVRDRLRAAAPSFEWLANHNAGRRPEIHICAFAHHVIDLIRADRTAELPAVFGLVEEMLGQDDQLVRDHMGGFFCGWLRYWAGDGGVADAAIPAWFGPRLHAAWRAAAVEWARLGMTPPEPGTGLWGPRATTSA
jgi:hypothetical protein